MSDEKPQPRLDPNRFHPAEHQRNIWAVTVEAGLTREEVTNEAFLAHVAAKCNRYDRIEVRSDDDSFFAELLVTSKGHASLGVHVLSWESLVGAEVEGDAPTGYRVEWKGPHKKHCVIRESDNAIVHEGAARKADARFWLDEHLKVIRKAAA